MKKKTIILLLSVYYSVAIFAQITSGELSFTTIDSFTQEYHFKELRLFRDSLYIDNLSDTVVEVINGNYEIKIIDRLTYKDCYEMSRDSFGLFFSKDYVISNKKDDIMRLYNLNSKILTKYLFQDNKLNKLYDLRMYEGVRESGEIFDFKIDKKDLKRIGSVEGYKVEYKERFKYWVKIVKMYVCADIKCPIRIFVNFPEDANICPIYIEQYDEKTPKNKSIRNLCSATEVPEILIENKVKEVLGLK